MQQCFASRSDQRPGFTAIVTLLTFVGAGPAVSYVNNMHGNGDNAFHNQMFTEDAIDDYVNVKLPGVGPRA